MFCTVKKYNTQIIYVCMQICVFCECVFSSAAFSQVVNDLVFSGSSDQCVYAHNIHVSRCYSFASLISVIHHLKKKPCEMIIFLLCHRQVSLCGFIRATVMLLQ